MLHNTSVETSNIARWWWLSVNGGCLLHSVFAEIELGKYMSHHLKLSGLFLDPLGYHLLLSLSSKNADTPAELLYLSRKAIKPKQVSFSLFLEYEVVRDSSVGIATRYELDGPGIESRGGEIFCIRPDRPWGPPSLLYNGYRIIPAGKAAGAWSWPPTPI